MSIDWPTTLVASLIAALIAIYFYHRSKQDLQEGLEAFSEAFAEKDTLKYFEYMLLKGTWEQVEGGETPTWTCHERRTLSILQRNDWEEFDEPWTARVPDQHHNRACTIELRINNVAIDTERFVAVDGFRWLVPMPTQRHVKGDRVYFWETESIPYKVGLVIGRFYHGKSMKDAAKFFDIDVVPTIPK